MEKRPLYLCDYKKNTACSRKICAHNVNRIGGPCWATKDPKFAELDQDGNPIQVVMIGIDGEIPIDSELHPFMLRADVDFTRFLAKIAASIAILSLVLAITALTK